jgi:hypothetical protein
MNGNFTCNILVNVHISILLRIDLVVTQLSTDHHLMCVCVLLCLIFIIAIHLGNKKSPLSLLTL